MMAWWSDVIKEAEHEGFHTRVVQISHRYGMILFIASEVMFFVAWFWAFFSSALFVGDPIEYARAEFTGGIWPPKGIEALEPVASAAAQHAAPADLRHDRDMGAPRAAAQ